MQINRIIYITQAYRHTRRKREDTEEIQLGLSPRQKRRLHPAQQEDQRHLLQQQEQGELRR